MFLIYCQLQQNPVLLELVIAPGKVVQRQPSFEYLGIYAYSKEIKPQKLEIKRERSQTLNDFQNYCVI